ncbi:MAG TPA: aminotransferase class I/II-fold pyridoxal phosphate-dependent enzyme [Vicinamibacteria bacterium]|nr:aminotransferase class I/II-fold pyridoxal phosphate-dependent enzyme [Vicinamibacteria bacterium]
MKLETFVMERTQSVWENRVEVNLAESGVEPMTLGELVDGANLSDTRLSYPQTNGTEELRDRIADLYPGADADNVVAANGTAEANYVAVTHLVEPGDEVVVMMPNYMQIWGLARSLGARVHKLPLHEEASWGPDLDELRRVVNDKTRLIAVCNPNNPTGAVLSEDAMREIAKIAGSVGAYILADEVYQGAELDGELSPTFYGWYDRLIVTSGLSKAYGLPGLRMGWMVADEGTSAKLWSYKDYTTIAPGALSDRLATIALEPGTRQRILERTRGILNRQLPLIDELVERHEGRLSLVPPKAGAIAFVRYDWEINSTVLMERVREEKSLLIVPGDHFDIDSYIRIGYGYDEAKLADGLARLSDFLGKLD